VTVEASQVAAAAPAAPVIAVVGDVAFDISLAVDGLDAADEKITATGGFRSVGGTGANAAASIARLGGRARLHAMLGSDAIGRWIREELAARRIDTSGLAMVEGQSTLAVIILGPGGRTVIVDRGVADALDKLAPASVLDGVTLAYLSSIPVSIAARFLAAAACPVVVGVEARQAPELAELGTPADVAALLDRAAVVLTNEAGEAAIVETSRHFQHAALVVTRGPAGATIRAPGEPDVDLPAPAVDAVDSTGAGDCFAGALCRFMADGTSLPRAVFLATVAASLSTRRHGAQAGYPDETEVLAAARAIDAG
jgi:sugar/nucleoside kinase (ribokinase family)